MILAIREFEVSQSKMHLPLEADGAVVEESSSTRIRKVSTMSPVFFDELKKFKIKT